MKEIKTPNNCDNDVKRYVCLLIMQKKHTESKKKSHPNSIFDVSQGCLIKSASMIKAEIIFGT